MIIIYRSALIDFFFFSSPDYKASVSVAIQQIILKSKMGHIKMHVILTYTPLCPPVLILTLAAPGLFCRAARSSPVVVL